MRIPTNKGRNVIISKIELQVVNFCTITIINSHHEDLNNWSSEHCLWCNQNLQIICMNGNLVLAMVNVEIWFSNGKKTQLSKNLGSMLNLGLI